jgi:hypothetical protein
MKNLILKQGDSVRYMGMSPDIGRAGFGTGYIGEVKARPDGSLYVQNGHGVQLTLVDTSGTLTDHADYFSKVKGLVLPLGQNVPF